MRRPAWPSSKSGAIANGWSCSPERSATNGRNCPARLVPNFVAKLRQESRLRREQWVIAQRFWKELETKKELPCRLSDFSDKVKSYVKDYLLPKLTEDEKKQLTGAEGRWPDYPLALVEIASKHPSALPPLRSEELPAISPICRSRCEST